MMLTSSEKLASPASFSELFMFVIEASFPSNNYHFPEYLEVVESALRADSDACADRTKAAFEALRDLSQSGQGRKAISDKFK